MSSLVLLLWVGLLAAQPASYRMKVTVAPELRRLSISGTVTFQPLPHSRDSLKLVLWSEFKDVQFSAEESAVRVVHDSANGDRSWTIYPQRSFAPKRPLTIRFAYYADSASSAQLRVTQSSTVASGGAEAWYPRLAFDSLGSGVIEYDVPADYTVIASGQLMRTQRGRARATFVYNASTPTHITFAAAAFKKLTRPGQPNVTLFSLRDRSNADSSADRAARVVAALSNVFGALPDTSFAVAEIDFGGSVAGIGAPSFFLASPSTFERGLPLPFVAHEVGHAWWGGLVGTAGVGRMMLTEGNASFGMLHAIGVIEGDSAAESYRRGSYPGYHVSGTAEEYFRMIAAGIDLPIADAVPRGSELMIMHRVVNTKGMLALDMLAREIGSSTLTRALALLVAENSGRQVTWTQYRNAIEAAAGRDLSWFFDQWFHRKGAPEFDLSWKNLDGDVAITVTQSEPTYRVRLEIGITDAHGRTRIETVNVSERVTHVKVPAPTGVRAVALDPHERVLRWTPERRQRALALSAYSRAEFQRRFGSRATAIQLFTAALDSVPPVDKFGARFLTEYGSAQALYDQTRYKDAELHIKSALMQPVRDPDLLPWAYVLAARIAQKLGNTSEVESNRRAATLADEFASTRTGAIEAAARIKP